MLALGWKDWHYRDRGLCLILSLGIIEVKALIAADLRNLPNNPLAKNVYCFNRVNNVLRRKHFRDGWQDPNLWHEVEAKFPTNICLIDELATNIASIG